MDISCSLVDDRRLAVAEVSLNWIVVCVTVGAVDLNRHRSGLLAANGGLPLSQARCSRVCLSGVLQVTGLQTKQPAHLIVGFHVCDFLFDELMVRDLGPKRFTFESVRN